MKQAIIPILLLARIIREGRRVDKKSGRRPGFGRHERHFVTFERFDHRVENVFGRGGGALRHPRQTSAPNTPALDRFSNNRRSASASPRAERSRQAPPVMFEGVRRRHVEHNPTHRYLDPDADLQQALAQS